MWTLVFLRWGGRGHLIPVGHIWRMDSCIKEEIQADEGQVLEDETSYLQGRTCSRSYIYL